MRNIKKKNLFLWTLRGKSYFNLAGSCLALLVLIMEVL